MKRKNIVAFLAIGSLMFISSAFADRAWYSETKVAADALYQKLLLRGLDDGAINVRVGQLNTNVNAKPF